MLKVFTPPIGISKHLLCARHWVGDIGEKVIVWLLEMYGRREGADIEQIAALSG